jgi:hypothetical protein
MSYILVVVSVATSAWFIAKTSKKKIGATKFAPFLEKRFPDMIPIQNQ